MITVRHSNDRGYADHGWLKAKHSFSFADYYDPAEMGWGALRVINEDRVAPGKGFGTHGHRDMEIVTYILSGALEHKDNLGSGGIIKRGEVQRMSAGRGVMHSEFNPSQEEETHLLQIWIEPAQSGTVASFEQQTLALDDMRGQWRLVASPDGAEGSTTIGQDARILATVLGAGEGISHRLAKDRLAYVQLTYGQLDLNGKKLSAGDGAKIANESELHFLAGEETEFLLFDLPPQV
jgi:redox-sensitive bicupin YhaK (pirin superfamily)